jgi:probable phosphoglycerate mutase
MRVTTITTELLLARHPEAACNVAGIVGGERGCTGLTARGNQQGLALADRLACEHAARPIDVVYTTMTRQRVRDTVAIIMPALGLTATVEPDLRICDPGDADGRLWRDVKNDPPYLEPDQTYANGAESWHAYRQRILRKLRGILDRHDGQRILVLSHGDTIQAANDLLLSLPPESSRTVGFVTSHACLTHWQRHVSQSGQAVWKLLVHNDTSHLPEILRAMAAPR